MSLLEKLVSENIAETVTSKEIIEDIGRFIKDNGYTVVDDDLGKPWGAFWRFDSAQAAEFIAEFFPGLTLAEAEHGVKGAELSPKILLVAPQQRLSGQYHHRRAERWRNVAGPAAYYRSLNDDQGDRIDFPVGSIVQFDTGERHRLASGDCWSVVAEIWQHSDPNQLSDEEDIIRVADDYKR